MAPAACAAPAYRDTVAAAVAAGNAWSSQYAWGVLAIVVSSGLGGSALSAAAMARDMGST